MFQFILIFSALLLSCKYDFFHFLKPISDLLHSQCLSWISASQFWELKAALICGEDIQNSSIKKTLIHLNVYHVAVISAAQLQSLHFIFYWLGRPLFKEKTPTLAISWIYVLMVGMNPPVTRAWFFLSWQWFNRKFRWHWSSSLLLMASCLITIAFHPAWIQSLSLCLSVVSVCGLAMVSSIRPSAGKIEQALWAAILIHLLLAPLLIPFHQWNLWQFLPGMVLAPVLGIVLLPYFLLEIFFPSWISTSDLILSGVLKFLDRFEISPIDFQITVSATIYMFSSLAILFALDRWLRVERLKNYSRQAQSSL